MGFDILPDDVEVLSSKFGVICLELECLGVGGDKVFSPFAMATLNHLFALTASYFLSNATKSNQKRLRSVHTAPTLRFGVPSLRSCSREDRAVGPILGPSA